MSGGSSKAQTIGYRYFMTLQMGIGRGPINELIEIRVADKMAWFGSVTGNQTVSIEAGELFGGDQGEGGIRGVMDVMMGGPTQGKNSRLVAMRGALQSAFRGVATLVYDGLICSMNPYPKPWRMRVRRTTAGWDREAWYPERANIYFYDNYTKIDMPNIPVGYLGDPDFFDSDEWADLVNSAQIAVQEELVLRRRTINAMNPAHILIEIATNKAWGRGMPDDQIDWDTFRLAADKLWCEKFGLCMRWNRQSAVGDIVAEIINTIGAMQYVSRNTGKLTLKLIRDDYDPDGLPVFTRTSGILSINNAEKSGNDSGFNEIVVKYKSPVLGEPAAVRYQNLGSVMSDAGVNSNTVEYLSVPHRDLAVKLAARDVRASTSEVGTLDITLDRRGWPLEPGSVFRLQDEAVGYADVVMRVVTIKNEDYVNGTITIQAVTDIYGLPNASYLDERPEAPDGDSQAPAVATQVLLVESSYRDLYQAMDRANFEILDNDVAFLGSLVARPANQVDYLMLSRAAGEETFADSSPGSFSPVAKLPYELNPLDTLIAFTQADLSNVQVGEIALINREHVKVVAVDPMSMIVMIERGCLDTIPARHPAESLMWFYEDDGSYGTREFVAGETVQAKILPASTSARLSESLAPTLSLTMTGRFGQPYVPGNLQINGESAYLVPELESGAEITWARRNRVTQQDIVYGHTAGDITPEAGQTVTIRLRRADTLAVVEEVTGLTGTSHILTFAYAGAVILEVLAERDGLESYQKYQLPYGYNGVSFVTEDSITQVTELADILISED